MAVICIESAELLQKLTDKGQRCYVTGVQLNDSLTLPNQSIITASSITFENVTFVNQFFISDQPLGNGIKFIGCSFQNNCTLRNVSARGEDIIFDNEKRSVVFENCEFNKRFEILGEKTSVEKGVYIKDCNFSGGFFLENCNIGQFGLKIFDSTINAFFSIKNFSESSETSIYLRKCSVDTVLEIEKCSLKNLTFSQCTMNDVCNIQHNFFKIGISFFEGEFKGEVNIDHNAGTSLALEGTKFLKLVEVSHHDFENIDELKFDSIAIRGCSFANGFYLTGLNKLLPVNGSEMQSILIECSALLQGDIHVENFRLNSVTLRGVNTKANIIFNNLYVHDFLVKEFYNYSQLVLSNFRGSTAIGRFQIERSNLGKTQLNQVDFQRFRDISIQNAVLNEIIATNIVWFNPKMIRVHDEHQMKKQIVEAKKNAKKDQYDDGWIYKTILAEKYSDVRETFRQLKYAMDKNGDRAQMLTFQSFEMNYYRKYLNLANVDGGNYHETFPLPRSKNFIKNWLLRLSAFLFGEKKVWSDRFILWTSLSNDFGQNWWKPTWILLCAAFVLYIPIAFCASDLSFKFSNVTQDVAYTFYVLFWKQLKLYPQLLNPTHDLAKLIDNKNPPGIIYFYDFAYKLTVSYFIFQIITAFRKYVK